MASPHPIDLSALSVRRDNRSPITLRPRRHWISRVVVPVLIITGFLAIAAWAAWDTLQPRAPVTVSPVVARAGVVQATGAELFSATGWIEPRPTAIDVGALTEGVVEELLVLPGQSLKAGDVVARLIDAEARLEVEAARRELRERQLKIATAEADVREAQAQLAGVEATLKGDADLYEKGVIGPVRYQQTLAQKAAAEARIDQMRARLQEAKARAEHGETMLRMAELRLERMAVRTPAPGVVMSLNVVPGRMVGVRQSTIGQPESLATLYDPDRLQVRVEVPIDKFHLVSPGQPALVEVDVMPDRSLRGQVLYDTHETDIQRNTVRVKVGLFGLVDAWMPPSWPLQMPDFLALSGIAEAGRLASQEMVASQGKLRPGMIARVRVLSPPTESKATGGEVMRIMIPRKLITQADGKYLVWLVDQAAGRAALKPVALGAVHSGELVEVTEGLMPSDKLITRGMEGLHPGQRVRIAAEEP